MGSATGPKKVPANGNRRDKQSKSARVEKGLPKVQRPVTTAEQLESELWAARLGFCGWWQLASLPEKTDGIPMTFKSHPFRYIDHKEAAAIKKRPAAKVATRSMKNDQRILHGFWVPAGVNGGIWTVKRRH